MAKIIADYRERTSGIVKELARKGLDVELQQLVIADFVIQTKNLDGSIINVAIERKTVNDFLNSIIDKRLISQLMEMKKFFTTSILIIEGEENIYQIRNFHPNAIRGMLATLAVDFQVPMISTKNIRDTAGFLEILANRLEKNRSVVSLLKKPRALTLKEQQEALIMSLPGVGPHLARNLLGKFGSVKKVLSATDIQLQKVDKIGEKKAAQIRKVIDSLYNAEDSAS